MFQGWSTQYQWIHILVQEHLQEWTWNTLWGLELSFNNENIKMLDYLRLTPRQLERSSMSSTANRTDCWTRRNSTSAGTPGWRRSWSREVPSLWSTSKTTSSQAVSPSATALRVTMGKTLWLRSTTCWTRYHSPWSATGDIKNNVIVRLYHPYLVSTGTPRTMFPSPTMLIFEKLLLKAKYRYLRKRQKEDLKFLMLLYSLSCYCRTQTLLSHLMLSSSKHMAMYLRWSRQCGQDIVFRLGNTRFLQVHLSLTIASFQESWGAELHKDLMVNISSI